MSIFMLLFKATILILLGLAGAWLMRHRRAAVRHSVLAASLAALSALPIASTLVPPVRISLPASTNSSLDLDLFTQTAGSVPPNAVAGGQSVSLPAQPRPLRPSLLNVLIAFWLAGATVFLLRMTMGLLQVRALCRSGLPWSDGQSVLDRVALEAGIDRSVDVLLHVSLSAPVTCGVLHPAIVLPPDAPNWEHEDLHRALIHELEHVRRCDWMTHCFARAVRAVYWFHPLVWIAWHQLVLEAERSCDDAVIGRSEATAYADQLVSLAQRLSSSRNSPALAMASRSDLSARVVSVLDGTMQRGRAGTAPVLVAASIATVVVLIVSPLTMAASPQFTFGTPGNRLKFDVAAIRPCNPANGRGEGAAAAGAAPHHSAPNHTTFACFSLIGLIDSAYVTFAGGISHRTYMPKIEGAPAWAVSDRYNIEAKADSSPGWEMLRGPLLQSLLEDRFALKIHSEAREGRTYALSIAKGGLKLPRFAGGCNPVDWTKHQLLNNLASPEDLATACGSKTQGKQSRITMDTAAMNMDMFAVWVGQAAHLDGPVINKTGIDGFYRVHVQYESDSRAFQSGGDATEQPFESVFTAIQQQLGLKLEATRGPRQVLVIDHVEKPSGN